jgi:SAM-dependent methyltransferase
MGTELKFTGERFVPGDPNAQGEMWFEHWHRYHFVLPLVAGGRVLDVACGEGYGAALMADRAAQVTGADIAGEAIRHARATYGARANLEFVEAPCQRLPFAAGSFDTVISFETLEHIEAQEAFLDEARRVLTPSGTLVISTPNKLEYSDKRGYANEYHVKELYREEFAQLLGARFGHVRWLSQRNVFVSLIAEGARTEGGEWLTVSQAAPQTPVASLPPMYYVALASNDAEALEAIEPRLSVFCDAEEWAHNDWRNTYRAFQHHKARETELAAEVERLKGEIARLAAIPAAPTTASAPTPDSPLARMIKKLSD